MKHIAFCFLLACSAATGFGQQDPTLVTGLIPYNSFHGGDIDSVNLANGALNVRIPLVSYPQVGGKLKLSFSFVWRGKAVSNVEFCNTDYTGGQTCESYWQDSSFGPFVGSLPYDSPTGIVDDQDVQTESYEYVYSPEGEGMTHYYGIANFLTSDGALHPAIDVPAQANSLSGQRSLDGTNFFNGNPQATEYLPDGPGDPVAPACTQSCYTIGPDGISYYPNSSVLGTPYIIRQDSNGNKITLTGDFVGSEFGNYAYSGTGSYVDTANRTIPTIPAPSTTADQTGCTGPLPIAAVSIWTPPGLDGAPLTYKFCYVAVGGVITNMPSLGVGGEYIQSIVLPNGEAWTFEYNSLPISDTDAGDNYGELSKITYPTGGTISYQYNYFDSATSSSESLAVVSRTVNDNNGSGNQTWNYSYSYATAPPGVPAAYANDPSTVVTDPLTNETVHVFDIWTNDELYTQYYDHTDGLVHKTIAKTYQDIDIADEGGTVGYLNSFPTKITTTLDGAPSTVETMSYCPSGSSICGFTYDSIPEGSLGANVASFGKLAQDAVYNYSYSGQGTLLSSTATQYQFQTAGGASYLNENFLDLTASTTVSDTTQRSQTAYGYDTTGDQTSVSRWLNTGGTIESTTAYNSQGMPTLLTDPKGNETSISYQCANSLLYQVTKAYQSTTTLPETTTYGYDCPSGKLTSVIDPNNVTTQYSYIDPLNRLTQIKRAVNTAAENWTTYSYPTANQVNAAQDLNTKGDGLLQSSTIVDGLGRVIRKDAPAGSITDITYDAIGRVQSVSNPHFSMPSNSDGITSYAYDALNRKVFQCHPDNGNLIPCAPGSSYLQWVYNGNLTTSYDELRNKWTRTYDSLGRLTNVSEPNNAPTAYTYDALGNLWTASQTGISGETLRSRSFTYDSLSRLLTASNPESGKITYSYDADSNLYTKTDARNVETTYSYDALNRLLSKSYSNDTAGTPFSCYQYDLASSNRIGRLVSQWTQSAAVGSCPATSPSTGFWTRRSILAYDAMGRLLNEQQYTPASQAAGKFYAPAYTYDLAGDLLTSTDGSTPSPTTPGTTLTFTNTYDSAEHLVSLASNWIDVTHPSSLFSLPTVTSTLCANSTTTPYTPFGTLQNAKYGSGLTLNRVYDPRLRMTCEMDSSSNSTAISGTATVTITGSEGVN